MYPKYAAPSRFNIVGEREVNNFEMVELVGSFMGMESNVNPVNFHASRPGHDPRYALDGTHMASIGWEAPTPFESSLKKTVEWYIDNEEWLMP